MMTRLGTVGWKPLNKGYSTDTSSYVTFNYCSCPTTCNCSIMYPALFLSLAGSSQLKNFKLIWGGAIELTVNSIQL